MHSDQMMLSLKFPFKFMEDCGEPEEKNEINRNSQGIGGKSGFYKGQLRRVFQFIQRFNLNKFIMKVGISSCSSHDYISA